MIPVRTSQSIRTHRHARHYRFLKTMTGPHQLFEAIGHPITHKSPASVSY